MGEFASTFLVNLPRQFSVFDLPDASPVRHRVASPLHPDFACAFRYHPLHTVCAACWQLSKMRSLLALAAAVSTAVAYPNGAPNARLPTLGWSSWVALGPGAEPPIFDFCDEFSVKASADAFIEVGLYDAGYRHFHLDDCWAGGRNATGYLYAELDHFPNGMKPVGAAAATRHAAHRYMHRSCSMRRGPDTAIVALLHTNLLICCR